MRHLPPLHRAASVSGLERMGLSPNAVQTVRAAQATLARVMFWAPAGLGVADESGYRADAEPWLLKSGR